MGDWSVIGHMFVQGAFVWDDGRFLLLGPYAVEKGTSLQAIYGKVRQHSACNHEQIVIDIFGDLRQRIAPVWDVEVLAATDLFCPSGIAFVVPSGWGFPHSATGPALLSCEWQFDRYRREGFGRIREVFSVDDSQSILAALDDSKDGALRLIDEYQLHGAGHATGVGLAAKLASGDLASPQSRAVEEWRADGVGHMIARRGLHPTRASECSRVTLGVRLGIDATGSFGAEKESDVLCARMTLWCMLASGEATIEGKQLAIRDLSIALTYQAELSYMLTRCELGEDGEGIARVVDVICAGAASVAGLLDPY